MTFQQLQYLLEVSKTGSVTQAAKRLFVSYSSVSISITNLEKELGYPLFTRNRKGLIPTPRGEQVLEHARRICQSYALLNAVDQQTQRTVRISGSDNLAFNRAYARLVEENLDRQDVQLVMHSFNAEDSHDKLLHNRLDLSLRMLMDFSFGYWEKRIKDDGLHRELLKTIPAAVRVGKGHRLYHAESVLPHELKNDRLVDNPMAPNTHSSLFNGTVYTDPERILYASAGGAQKELVRRGLAYNICSMPPRELQEDDDLRYIPLSGVNYHLLAITNPQFPTPPEIDRFLQLLRLELEIAYPE